MTNTPNIVLIHVDQFRYDMIGAHGNEVVRTPNLDRLVADGASFPNAFSTCPICTPARASLMTGAWPTTHGVLGNASTDFYRPARRELPALTQLLADAGYHVAMVGKYAGELEGAPTDYGVHRYISDREYRVWADRNGVANVGGRGGLFGTVLREVAPESSSLAFQADRVIEVLRDAIEARDTGGGGTRGGRGGGGRFFVRWDPPEPHLPYRPTAPFFELYDGVRIPPWPSFPDPLRGKPAPIARQRFLWGIEGWSWDDWEPTVRLYYAIISELDHHVGRVLAAIDEAGARDDTIVIFSTDHGDYIGGHGLMDKHFSMYDDIVRVPLIVRGPSVIEPGARPAGFVSQEIDIARTILDVAGIETPSSFVGRNLIDGDAAEPRTDIYSQYFGTESGMYSSRMLRDERWKFVWNPLDVDELYELENDPGEISNLIDVPDHADRISAMKRRLADWMQTVGDKLLNTWTRIELLDEPDIATRARSEGADE
ncbi:MAG: DUF4976 domain-containing protein [Spirochaetaceae bacterium]|nr:MAG: DUF4976 domain-containing protein [Spirochaetaceae bacterium]